MPYSFLLVVVAVAVEHDTVDMDCCDPARPDDRVISIAIEICVFFLIFYFWFTNHFGLVWSSLVHSLGYVFPFCFFGIFCCSCCNSHRVLLSYMHAPEAMLCPVRKRCSKVSTENMHCTQALCRVK